MRWLHNYRNKESDDEEVIQSATSPLLLFQPMLVTPANR